MSSLEYTFLPFHLSLEIGEKKLIFFLVANDLHLIINLLYMYLTHSNIVEKNL